MDPISAWLANKAIVVGIAIAALVAVPTAIIQTIRIDGVHIPLIGVTLAKGLNDQVADLTFQIQDPKTGYIAQLALGAVNLGTCKDQVGKQNQAVKDWKAEADKWQLQADQLLRDARTRSGALRSHADQILASPTIGDACIAAFNRNRDNAK
jgi:hypothetical protein